jgi:hypothetical protein
MMKYGRSFAVLLICLLSGTACGRSPSVSLPASNDTAGFNLLIVSDGDVQLKRNQWTDFHPASFGALLYRGDQIRPASGAKAIVLCNNLETWNVPAGTPSGLSNGCPQDSEPALVRSSSLIGNTRGSSDPLIPYIISPRATKLLTAKPRLSWNPVPGANSYTVHISGTDWQETVDTPELTYPGTPALQPGTDYLLVVESSNGKSSKDEGLPGLGFTLLPTEVAQKIRSQEARLDALKLPSGANTFARAQLYAGQGLYAEAIELLEKAAQQEKQPANIYLALGGLYQQTGLFSLAEARYMSALDAANQVNDAESLAAAQHGLGQVYTSLGNKTEAAGWLNKSKSGYENLGDQQQVKKITEELQTSGQ